MTVIRSAGIINEKKNTFIELVKSNESINTLIVEFDDPIRISGLIQSDITQVYKIVIRVDLPDNTTQTLEPVKTQITAGTMKSVFFNTAVVGPLTGKYKIHYQLYDSSDRLLDERVGLLDVRAPIVRLPKLTFISATMTVGNVKKQTVPMGMEPYGPILPTVRYDNVIIKAHVYANMDLSGKVTLEVTNPRGEAGNLPLEFGKEYKQETSLSLKTNEGRDIIFKFRIPFIGIFVGPIFRFKLKAEVMQMFIPVETDARYSQVEAGIINRLGINTVFRLKFV